MHRRLTLLDKMKQAGALEQSYAQSEEVDPDEERATCEKKIQRILQGRLKPKEDL